MNMRLVVLLALATAFVALTATAVSADYAVGWYDFGRSPYTWGSSGYLYKSSPYGHHPSRQYDFFSRPRTGSYCYWGGCWGYYDRPLSTMWSRTHTTHYYG